MHLSIITPDEDMIQSHITHTAKASGVTRQTLYNWIEKGCIKYKKNYRNYSVFTKDDIEGIKKAVEGRS